MGLATISNALFQGMCHATAESTYFAHLYAAIEKFRASSDLFHFVNFDGIARSDRFRLELSGRRCGNPRRGPHQLWSRIVTIASAFTGRWPRRQPFCFRPSLARRRRPGAAGPALPLWQPRQPNRRVPHPARAPNITLTGLVSQGGICTKMAPKHAGSIIAGSPASSTSGSATPCASTALPVWWACGAATRRSAPAPLPPTSTSKT